MTDGGWTAGQHPVVYIAKEKVVPLSNLGVDRGLIYFVKPEKRGERWRGSSVSWAASK